MWRPKDWEEIKDRIEPEHLVKGEHVYYYFLDGVEAGADAMLEALRNEPKPIGELGLTDPPQILKEMKGKWVFIPDDKEEK